MIEHSDNTERQKAMMVHATLPACPHCGIKDRERVRGGTHRPFGREIAVKVQYCECGVCGEQFRITWS